MAQNRYLQLLRNSSLVADYATAVTTIEGKAASLADGTPIVVRFNELVDGTNKVRALLGVAYSQGDVKNISFVELGGERIADVKSALSTAISNAQTALQNAINGEETRALAAEAALGTRIDGINTAIQNKNVQAEGETGDAALVIASANDNKVTVASTDKLQEAVALAETALQSSDKTELSDLIKAEEDRAKLAEQTLTDGLKAVTDDYLTSADKTTLEGQISAAETASKVTITPSTPDGVLKRYTFTQGETELGSIDLAKDLVVTGGQIIEKEGVKYLQLTIANQEAPVEIAVTDLVDVYTGSTYVEIGADNAISVKFDVLANALTAEGTAVANAIKANADAIKAEEERALEAEGELEAGLKAVTDDYLTSADRTTLNGLITAEQQRAEGVESGLNTRLGVVEGAYMKAAEAGSYVTLGTKEGDAKVQTISVNVSSDETNALVGKDNSLYVSNVWDCGYFDQNSGGNENDIDMEFPTEPVNLIAVTDDTAENNVYPEVATTFRSLFEKLDEKYGYVENISMTDKTINNDINIENANWFDYLSNVKIAITKRDITVIERLNANLIKINIEGNADGYLFNLNDGEFSIYWA